MASGNSQPSPDLDYARAAEPAPAEDAAAEPHPGAVLGEAAAAQLEQDVHTALWHREYRRALSLQPERHLGAAALAGILAKGIDCGFGEILAQYMHHDDFHEWLVQPAFGAEVESRIYSAVLAGSVDAAKCLAAHVGYQACHRATVLAAVLGHVDVVEMLLADAGYISKQEALLFAVAAQQPAVATAIALGGHSLSAAVYREALSLAASRCDRTMLRALLCVSDVLEPGEYTGFLRRCLNVAVARPFWYGAEERGLGTVDPGLNLSMLFQHTVTYGHDVALSALIRVSDVTPEMLDAWLDLATCLEGVDRSGVIRTLLEHGANPNGCNNQMLSNACRRRGHSAAVLLLRYRAQANACDDEALDHALHRRDADMVRLLLAHGANLDGQRNWHAARDDVSRRAIARALDRRRAVDALLDV